MNERPSLDPSGKSLSKTRIHVEIRREIDGYDAVIRALGVRSGERRLTDAGPGCQNLAEALALTLAIILDAGQGTLEPAPTAGEVRISPRRGFEPRLGAPRDTGSRRPSGNVVDVAAGFGVHAGALAETGWLFTALGRVSLGEFLILEAGGFVTDEQTVAHERSNGELTLRLASGFLGVCARLAAEGPVSVMPAPGLLH